MIKPPGPAVPEASILRPLARLNVAEEVVIEPPNGPEATNAVVVRLLLGVEMLIVPAALPAAVEETLREANSAK